METAWQPLFRAAVQDPLTRVIETSLVSVTYFVLRVDLPGYEVSSPNDAGDCQGIQMVFGGGTVELDWDFRQQAFRDESTCFYLAVRATSERGALLPSAAKPDEANIVPVDATAAWPWHDRVNESLAAVTVWGWRLKSGGWSPQAVSFSFPSAEVSIGIGYGGNRTETWGVGDGDELLVLSESQWLPQLEKAALVPVWCSRNDGEPPDQQR